MSLEVFGDGGDVEELDEVATSYGYSLCSDDKWRETMDDDGFTDEQMWDYIWSRRESEAEEFEDD